MKVKAISISDKKGVRKINVENAELIKDFGIKSDAHGGLWHRQLSLLAEESIQSMRDKGLDVVAGNFAENITTEGINLTSLKVGNHIKIGNCEIIISQLGKVCHNRCAIYHQAGDCVMPREGIFGVIPEGGPIKVGDPIEILKSFSESTAIVLTAESENFMERITTKVFEKWSSPVIRFDIFNPKKNNLQAIIDDLVKEQQVTRIIILDPEKHHLFNEQLFGDKVDDNEFIRKSTSIYYHNSTVDEF